ncbi:MAG: YicC family protein [Alphaproteobacteria bacterium]|nr:YicC family protein [Alphaproteobacteria bacterium]
MTLASMTGFASDAGSVGDLTWVWELKSVNGKALDVRLRMPQGYDHLEIQSRNIIMQHFKRGNIQAGLSVSNGKAHEKLSINTEVMDQYLALARELHAKMGGEAPRADNLLAMRGVLEVVPVAMTEEEQKSRDAAILTSLDEAVAALDAARLAEGSRLRGTLVEQVKYIARLTNAAKTNPSRSPDAIKARLKEQVTRILEASNSFDPDRLHQEAVMIATRADIQEEIDRLNAHVSAAHDLLASTEPVGRKLDFLAQEFNREANTLCSKAGDKTMSAIGLEMKTIIDQLREQVQNIE